MAREIISITVDEAGESVKLVFDGGDSLRLSAYDWYGLSFARKPGEVTDGQYDALVRIEECSRAKNKLLSLLSYSGNSRKGFAGKLKRYGFSEESITAALDFAEEKKLISDEAYAASLAYELVEVKRYGPIRVKSEMRRHGVPDDVAKETTVKYDEKDGRGLSIYDRNMYASALEKAKGLHLSDRATREKLFAALSRAGYELSRISKLRFIKK